MRVAKTEKYDTSKKIITRKIDKMEPLDRSVVLLTPKAEEKFVKTVERYVRSSMEYRDFIKYLKDNIDMTYCSYFNNITSTNARKKVSIHIHHEPFTLYDITLIVFRKWVDEGLALSHLGIAEEVMKLHYQGYVGLIPLSATVHDLVHCGKLIIPLDRVYGRYSKFVQEYGKYIPEDILEMLERKVKESRELTEEDVSILEKKYVYLEVDGFTFPQKVDIE